MFNLERAIANWRRRMAAGGIKAVEVLDELESHLRDEIERQMQTGSSEEEAYHQAVSRIGDVKLLKAEFAKARLARRRSRKGWYAFYFGSIVFMVLINSWTLAEYDISRLGRLFGFSAVWVTGLYLACLPHWLQSLAPVRSAQFLKVLKVATNLLWVWPLWALATTTHAVHVELGISIETALWCLYGAVCLSALAWGLSQGGKRGGSEGPAPPFQSQPTPIPPTEPSPPDLGTSLPPGQTSGPVVREVLRAAREEAARLGHDFVGTEHVLLAVLRLAEGAFGQFLRRLNLDSQTVRLEVERAVWRLPMQAAAEEAAFTPRACTALKLASREARKSNRSGISAEHIFLGLLLERSGIAGQVLRKLGVKSKSTRAEISSQARFC
jgi:hypothetical protein